MSSSLNLHQELKRGSFDFALLTTYEFDGPFFESFVLSNLDALAKCDDIVLFMDQGKHAELLHAEGARRPRLAGLRYIPTPVRCAGVFHPKVFLLTSRDRGLLMIGSANLTRAGLSRNAELVGAWRYDRSSKAEKQVALFQDAFRFLSDIASRWPTPSVTEIMRDAVRECDWLVPSGDTSNRSPDNGVRLAHNLTVPLWPQLLEAAGDVPQRVSVVSPYFESEPTILDQFTKGLASVKVRLHTERRRTTMTAKWLEHPLVRSGRVTISVGSYGDGQKPQMLHGKALAIATRSETLLAYGSANFTRPALLHASDRGNIEALVLVPGLPAKFDVTRLFDPLATGATAAPDDLFEEPQQTASFVETLAFRLIEARIEDGRLVVVAEPPTVAVVKWTAEVIMEGCVPVLVPLRVAADGALIGTVTADLLQMSATQMATVRVVATCFDGSTLTSALGFLLNLRDAPTGARRRQERRVREAQLSAERFAEVLSELLTSHDEAALIRFLLVCNIHLGPEVRRGTGRPVRAPWQPAGLRILGERNVSHFLSVHEAALDFIDRHIRRLQRHATSPVMSGIPSIMHVTRSLVEVIRAQLVRLVIGLELTTRPLKAEVWGRCRENASQYLVRTQQLFTTIASYTEKLMRGSGREKTRLALAPDLSPLREVVDDLLGIRDRLNDCRLRVRTSAGIVPAPYFDRDVLGEHRFRVWASDVRSRVDLLSG